MSGEVNVIPTHKKFRGWGEGGGQSKHIRGASLYYILYINLPGALVAVELGNLLDLPSDWDPIVSMFDHSDSFLCKQGIDELCCALTEEVGTLC